MVLCQGSSYKKENMFFKLQYLNTVQVLNFKNLADFHMDEKITVKLS